MKSRSILRLINGRFTWAILTGLGLGSLSAIAGPLNLGEFPQLQKAYPLKDVGRIYFTPRGKSLFQTELTPIIEEGLKANLHHFSFDKPIDYTGLGPITSSSVHELKVIRDVLTSWFNGPYLRDPKFDVNISNIGIDIENPKVTASFIKRIDGQGIRLNVSFEASKVEMSAKSVKLVDRANPGFNSCDTAGVCSQPYGLTDPKFSLSADSSAQANSRIRINAVVDVSITPDGSFSFTVKSVDSNFDKAKLDLKFTDLLVPVVKIKINGQTAILKREKLEGLFRSKLPYALTKLQGYVIERLFPVLQTEGQKFLTSKFSRPYTFSGNVPLSDSDGNAKGKLFWNIKPGEILDQGDLTVFTVDASVNDSIMGPGGGQAELAKTTPMFEKFGPFLEKYRQNEYDAALVLDRKLIDTYLFYAYKNRTMSKFTSKDGATTFINGAMQFDLLTDNQIRFDLIAAREASGIEKALLADKYNVYMQMLMKLEQLDDHQFQVISDYIDPDTALVAPYSQTGFAYQFDEMFNNAFKDSILDPVLKSQTKKSILANNESWKKDPIQFGPYTIPSDLFGVKTKIVGIDTEPMGYVVMYLELKR